MYLVRVGRGSATEAAPDRMMSDSSEYRILIQAAFANARRIVVDYVAWLVYELPPAPYDRRSTPSLIFEHEFVMRRVRNFPSEWRALSDDDLLALSWAV